MVISIEEAVKNAEDFYNNEQNKRARQIAFYENGGDCLPSIINGISEEIKNASQLGEYTCTISLYKANDGPNPHFDIINWYNLCKSKDRKSLEAIIQKVFEKFYIQLSKDGIGPALKITWSKAYIRGEK